MIKCCKAMICTECYLQAQDPDNQDSPCPFCKNDQMSLVVARPLSYDEADRRAIEEQKVLEATIQAKNNQLHGETQTLQSSFNSANTITNHENLLEEPMVNIPLQDDQYDTYVQISETSNYAGYEGYDGHAQIKESNFPTRNNMNTQYTQHLGIDDRENDIQTASELFLSELSEENQLELAIQLSLIDTEGQVDHGSFLF